MQQEIQNALKILQNGGIILYPTDTIWGIGCDATNESAVQKIYDLKRRQESKSMLVLVHNDVQLEHIIKEVPDTAWDIIDLSERPTTLVLDNPQNIASNLIAKDNSLGVRVTQDSFCKRLIQQLKAPLVSTSANISGEKSPQNFNEISPDILQGVDYIVNLRQNEKAQQKSSTVIKLRNNGEVKVLRQ
ncbi:L-threonylcarbamoyladenylate synthase [Flavobacteriaceae bacterium UJ101]|nr:L-threonylcarbamoyladenylate synthase [Flavobacteriaceae bacterium UJ101]